MVQYNIGWMVIRCMKIDFNSNLPLYIQIIEKVKSMLISGALQPKSPLPSVRELAQTWEVTPNTVQRALRSLEEEGYIITKRTTGKFVTSDIQLLETLRAETLKTQVHNTVSNLQQLGYSNAEISDCIEEELNMSEE